MHRKRAALTDFYDNHQGIEQERVCTLLHGTWFIPFIHFVLLNRLKGSGCARDVTLLCSPPNPALSWPNCIPRDAIQNRTCQFRTSYNNNNNNNKQTELDEANRGISYLLALIPVK